MDPEPLQIEVLGPVVVKSGGATPPALSIKLRALLLYLLWQGQAVERALLCGLLWPEVPEDRARLSLRVALSRLRQVLGDRLRADRLRVGFTARPEDEIDLHTLRALASGRTAVPARSNAAEVQGLLGRLRGPLGAGLEQGTPQPFKDWLLAARAALDAELGDLAAGAAARPAGPATHQPGPRGLEVPRAILDRDPLHEATVRELMTALARAGAYAEAETVYQTFATVLGQRTGLAPAPATERLRDRIAARRTWGAGSALPTPTPDPATGAELDRLVAWLVSADRRLVSLIGPPGSGKTKLALAAAWALADRFLDGVAWMGPADLARGSLLEQLKAPWSATARPMAPADGPPAWQEQERLWVLDGLDPVHEDLDGLGEVLGAAPGLRLLVTTRAPLGLVYEHRYPLSRR